MRPPQDRVVPSDLQLEDENVGALGLTGSAKNEAILKEMRSLPDLGKTLSSCYGNTFDEFITCVTTEAEKARKKEAAIAAKTPKCHDMWGRASQWGCL